MSNNLDNVLRVLEQNRHKAVERLQALIAIKSISTQTEYVNDCQQAAKCIADDLTAIGFTVSVEKTCSHPVVYARYDAPGPHVLFYGHYDVQPATPIEEWQFDPFASSVVDIDNRTVITGRGSSDDKGQMMTFVEACRAYMQAHGTLPCKVSLVIEGDEENSPEAVTEFLQVKQQELSDVTCALVCDTEGWNDQLPAITASLRGIVACELTVTSAARDMHSGMYGGAVINPITALSKMLAAVHDDDGKVLIPGFYQGVEPVSRERVKNWQRLDFDQDAFFGEVGAKNGYDKSDMHVLERLWSQPTCEFNGIVSGYTHEGVKTIVPKSATVKITCRLVAAQDPDKVFQALQGFFTTLCPTQLGLQITRKGAGMPAPRMPLSSEMMERVGHALANEWGRKPPIIGCGGSIPVVSALEDTLGVPALLLGFASDKDNIHAPDESYALQSFEKGCRSWVYALDAIALE